MTSFWSAILATIVGGILAIGGWFIPNAIERRQERQGIPLLPWRTDAFGGKAPDGSVKAATKKRRSRKHTAATSNSATGKKVVRNGGTADPVVQLSPGVSDEQASRQRQRLMGRSWRRRW